ncbi:MAG: indole-3-glycerol phosphate synthase TrpC [Candidatus Latescibacteria bacterium]|nr:indole-3-glycerol phosphate synthase TrpC [Candidatus Latescibacterota bacterium]
MTILDRIIAHKRQEIADRKRAVPFPGSKTFQRTAPRPFGRALRRDGQIAVIAEFKKASPSKGIIREDADPVAVARLYEMNDASAISVLTDEHFFRGRAEFLTAIREQVSLPVLRKDFIVDDYQVYEAAAIGADALLLIASVLTEPELIALQRTASDLGLECLVEVHHDDDLAKARNAGARMIGINNRDLTDFSVDLNTSLRLKARIPPEVVTVSESGIESRDDVLTLQAAGFDAILVGESLMRAPDIGGKLRELVGGICPSPPTPLPRWGEGR